MRDTTFQLDVAREVEGGRVYGGIGRRGCAMRVESRNVLGGMVRVQLYDTRPNASPLASNRIEGDGSRSSRVGTDATMRGSNGERVWAERTRSIVHDDLANERRDSAIAVPYYGAGA